MTRTWLYRRLLVILLLWLTAALRLHHSLQLGTQTDEGIHIAAAEQIASNGVKLYGELFENRTPGVHWLLAGAYKLTGPSVYTGRLLSISMAVLTVTALFTAAIQAAPLATYRVRFWGGILAAALFALAPLPLFWARYTMLEHFAAAAAAGSIAALLYGLNHRSPAATFSAGLLASLAVLFKQTELTLIAATAVALLLWLWLERERRATHLLLFWCSGALLIAILFLAVLAWQGVLSPFFVLLSGAERIQPLANLGAKAQTAAHWAIRRPHSLLALAALLLTLRRRTPQLLLLLLWAAAAWSALFLPARLDLTSGGFSHYLIVPAAAISALIGAALAANADLFSDSRYAKYIALTVLVASLLATPGWFQDLSAAINEAEYPQPTFAAERRIGHAASLLAAESEPIVVLSNAVFYHWAQRRPASRFFHYPAYFSESDIGATAAAELTEILANRHVGAHAGAVLISRMHLQERLPPSLLDALWQEWTPVALFPYPYQRDVILFRPRLVAAAAPAQASFDAGIDLISIEYEQLDGDIYLATLVWQAVQPPQLDYTVFVHVLDAQGQLVAQADSVPMAGFRPTSGWHAGELIVDYHWIELPPTANRDELSLSAGLYLPQSGERIPVQIHNHLLASENDAIKLPLE